VIVVVAVVVVVVVAVAAVVIVVVAAVVAVVAVVIVVAVVAAVVVRQTKGAFTSYEHLLCHASTEPRITTTNTWGQLLGPHTPKGWEQRVSCGNGRQSYLREEKNSGNWPVHKCVISSHFYITAQTVTGFIITGFLTSQQF
jgi:hypothetical protein